MLGYFASLKEHWRAHKCPKENQWGGGGVCFAPEQEVPYAFRSDFNYPMKLKLANMLKVEFTNSILMLSHKNGNGGRNQTNFE